MALCEKAGEQKRTSSGIPADVYKVFLSLDNDVVTRSDEFLPYFVYVFLVAGFEYDL